ncbi:MAG: HEAT repeat domain-containing protein [Candidatus Riflebacteria bacterium]|nr:HEAT repeat domain-containing protein [Candidatus Riflebacteria bacterium]
MDLMQDVIQTLDAPIKSFRIFAIEKAIQEGSSEELLMALQKRQQEEYDEECLILLAHAIESVKSRLSAPKSPDFIDLSENFCKTFSSAEPNAKLNILNSLSSIQIKESAKHAPELVAIETNPVVLAKIIRKFGSFWPEDKLQSLKQILLSNFLSARLSALEVLSSMHPESLVQDLPRLLSSDDPRIRALAVQGLSRIDMECALEHLENMLMGSNPDEKLCGLQNCLYLTFETVKPILIKFLASETSPVLLQKSGLLFQINADREIPFRLLELISRAREPRLGILKKIFSGACMAIEHSGILGNLFQSYMDHLKIFEKKAGDLRHVHELLSKLSTLASEQEFNEEFSRLRDFNDPDLLIALKTSLSWNISAHLKDRVREFLENLEKPSEPEKFPEKVFNPEGLSEEELIRTFASWRIENCELIRPVIKEVIIKHDSSVNLRASAIRAARRLKLAGFTESVESFLKSTEEKLTAASLEYTAHFDPDKIFPLMGYYLQNQSVKVKSAAIAVLKRFDSNRALSSLKALLSGKSQQQKKMAISCLVQFDFPLIRSLLFDFLLKNHDPEFVEPALCLFSTNPDPENLYDLFRLGKLLPTEFSEKISATRKNTEINLIELGLLKSTDCSSMDRNFQERLTREESKLKAPPKAYSINEIQKRKKKNGINDLIAQIEFTATELIGQNWKELATSIILIIFCLLLLISIFNKLSESNPRTNNRPKALIANQQTVIAQVLGIEKEYGAILIKAENETKYLLVPEKKIRYDILPGDTIKTSLVPFRLNDKGVIIVLEFKFSRIARRTKSN